MIDSRRVKCLFVFVSLKGKELTGCAVGQETKGLLHVDG